ncbi:MAG TPA: UvrD-helicase domain-containing protein, partial [Pirellulales bacterium]|nr:UvrD-helicase domain-containing protein [Pirellulales bacterium]
MRASAGTGKTFQLSNRYLQLVGAGVRPESILAVTFARKAAGEILARVVQRLADAALDRQACEQLAEQVRWSLDQAACGQLLGHLLANLHRLRIGTLDSFFVRLAGSFALELGLPAAWQIVEPTDDYRWRLEAIRRVLAAGKTGDLVALMHLLFKGETTRAISGQIASLVTALYDIYCEADADAWHQLERPARLTVEALSAAIEQLAAAPRPANGHHAKGLAADLVRARSDDWKEFVAKGLAMKVASGDTYFGKPVDPDLAALYRPLLKHAAGVLVGQVADQTEATFKMLKDFTGAYQPLKHERGGLLFGDVPRVLADAMAEGMWERASWRLDGSIAHLLVDEFQDTSLAQWQVLRPLATACCEGGGTRSFFAVGDVKQAIYRWRGGVSQIFDAAREELTGVGEQSLAKSWRSCQAVIDVVNQVFGHLTTNAALADFAGVAEAWNASYVEHTTAQTELAGHLSLAVAPAAEKGEKQADVTLRHAAGQIAQLAADSPGRTIGVLVRRNIAVRQLIHVLRGVHKIAASEEGGNPLVDSPAVQIVLSALNLADHPGDTVARFHVAHSPLGAELGITDHTDDAAAHAAMARLRRKLLTEGYGRTLYGWARMLATHCDPHDLRRLEQLVSLAYTFGQRAGVRPGLFAAYVREKKVEDPTATQVRVMTIHQAKGLEFDIVVLPELHGNLKGKPPELAVGRRRPIDPIELVCRNADATVRALLPPRFQKIFEIWPREAVGESLCLLYVAMTRAVHALHILVAPTTKTKKGEAGAFPKTFAGILRSALCAGRPLEARTVAHEHGDRNWNRAEDRSVESKTSVNAPAVDPTPQPIALRTSGRSRTWERRSPSELEGGMLVRIGNVLRLGQASFARGSLWHAWLERIEWLDEPPTEQESFRAIGRSLAAGLDGERELAAFWQTVVEGPARAWLCRSAYDDPRSLGLPAALEKTLKA